MATTYQNLKMFEDYMQRVYMQADLEFQEKVNAETGGTIRVLSRPTKGNFHSETTYGTEKGLVRNEAPNVRTAAAEKELKEISQVDIKTGVTSDRIFWQDIALSWAGKSPQEQAVLAAQAITGEMMKNKVETAYKCLVAFFGLGQLAGAQASLKDSEIEKVIDDQSGSTTADPTKQMDLDKLISAKMKLQDRFSDISGVVMHGSCFGQMQIRNLSKYSELFSGRYGMNFVYTTSDGLPIYVTDNPALTFTQGVRKFRTLLLKPGAVSIYGNNAFKANTETSNANVWIEENYKAEDHYNVGVMAGTWRTTTNVHPKIGTTDYTGVLAGLHSDSGVLDNPTSWRRLGQAEGKAVDFKHLPGVMLITQ